MKKIIAATLLTLISVSAFADDMPDPIQLNITNPELVGYYTGEVEGAPISFEVAENSLGLGINGITAYNIEKNGSVYKLQYKNGGKQPQPVDGSGNCGGSQTEFKGYCFTTVFIEVRSSNNLVIKTNDGRAVDFQRNNKSI